MKNKKSIIFRADGNANTGLGHLYRLFSLVETVKNKFDFVFLTKENSTRSVVPTDYNLDFIPAQITLMEEPGWLSENYNSSEHIIIADGYHFNSTYQRLIKNNGFKLIYIDDLATEHMYADWVINHSPQIRSDDFKAQNYTKFALGMDYAMLRPAFLKAARKPMVLQPIDSVFVNFGGSDVLGLTYKTVSTLLEIPAIKSINVILGAAFLDLRLFELQNTYSEKINIHKNLSENELIKVMQSCTFAIVPSSTILFELFCVKIPIYSGYFVDNQKNAFLEFKKSGVVYGEGDFTKLSKEQLKLKLEDSILKSNHLDMLEKQEKLLDGQQAKRHLQIIKTLL
ncbi:UDP-2,4-diacetamido-2,4,6-trideoxy-beta-L-altropyranose hydrolase [Winogradskyella sp.]|uniref:UDP-2,4-diacetamido-2,4, 6-trideoxy-beta-L-altropyranose hydrolase n=1 Tax=Winogradskyella sp. TaxID=1883156 RepID=UPI001B1448FD|nr:UDP-2,4-diacetamido-2,4,6-trideoxy-beta-L-altropyranose hydrolase [Winogradskyella sp.]MBO6879925.1 UDP-2,4-diacetamido-2,4,6-trideoxy-beta-L-altropyranose hydrolase [Winogradskyella sp.]